MSLDENAPTKPRATSDRKNSGHVTNQKYPQNICNSLPPSRKRKAPVVLTDMSNTEINSIKPNLDQPTIMYSQQKRGHDSKSPDSLS